MLHLNRKSLLVLIILGFAMITVACNQTSLPADIIPLDSTPTVNANGTMTISTDAITATSKTEIVEPVSPVPITKTMSITPGLITPKSKAVLKIAVDDLVRRLKVSTSAVKVIMASAVEWSDASLGCPQEGMVYAQITMPGYLIVLEAQGKQYTYHTNNRSFVVLCPPNKVK